MSADNPDEVLDLQQVTGIVPPDKVKPAAKKATPPPKRQPKSREEITAEVAAAFEIDESARAFEREEAIRAEIRAELEAEYKAKQAEQPAPADASGNGLEETNYLHIEPGPGEVVIHTVDDGLTFGPKVYMRGEELALNPEQNPWVNYSRTKQIQQFGKALYAKGPWPYGGYDLTDPNLSPEDKKRLLQVTESFG